MVQAGVNALGGDRGSQRVGLGRSGSRQQYILVGISSQLPAEYRHTGEDIVVFRSNGAPQRRSILCNRNNIGLLGTGGATTTLTSRIF